MCDAIISYGGFRFINHLFGRFYDKKRTSNLTSAFHASNALLLSGLYLQNKEARFLDYLTRFSTGYFLFDSINMVYHKTITPVQLGYIYHHMSSIYLLQQRMYPRFIGKIFFWAELSNIPGYFLYHYLHSKGNHARKIKILRIIQKWIYIKIRIFILTKIIYDFAMKNKNITSLYPVFPVYLLGVGWSLKILNQ